MQSGVKERLTEYLAYLGIGQKAFAEHVGLSAGFVNSIRVSIQPKTIEKIAVAYPDLNTAWLLTGEGQMTKTVSQTVGDIHGNAQGVNVNGPVHFNSEAVDKFLDEIAAQRRMTEKCMEQMDRLIKLLEDKK